MNDTASRIRGLPAGQRMRGALTEFALIVCGILAALAVNAWWQEHLDRAREQQYMEQLNSDVRDNQRRLEEALALERGQLQRATAILSALRANVPFSENSATALMTAEPPFPWFSDPRLLDGTIVALVATGDINLIRDDRVRVAAIRYQGQLRADLAEFGRKIGPFQELEGALNRLLELKREADADPDADDLARALVALQGNPEAAVVFRLFRMNIENRMWYLSQMLDATKAFLGILESGGETGKI